MYVDCARVLKGLACLERGGTPFSINQEKRRPSAELGGGQFCTDGFVLTVCSNGLTPTV